MTQYCGSGIGNYFEGIWYCIYLIEYGKQDIPDQVITTKCVEYLEFAERLVYCPKVEELRRPCHTNKMDSISLNSVEIGSDGYTII